jgi:hypothetical protein
MNLVKNAKKIEKGIEAESISKVCENHGSHNTLLKNERCNSCEKDLCYICSNEHIIISKCDVNCNIKRGK